MPAAGDVDKGTTDNDKATIKSDDTPKVVDQGNTKPPVTKPKNTEVKTKKPTSSGKTSSGTKHTIAYSYPRQNLKKYGTLTVKTNLTADILIDKIDYGKSNGPPIKLEPGRHFLEVNADGYRRMTRRIFTEEGDHTDIEIGLIRE